MPNGPIYSDTLSKSHFHFESVSGHFGALPELKGLSLNKFLITCFCLMGIKLMTHQKHFYFHGIFNKKMRYTEN